MRPHLPLYTAFNSSGDSIPVMSILQKRKATSSVDINLEPSILNLVAIEQPEFETAYEIFAFLSFPPNPDYIMDAQTQVDVTKLNEADKKELAQILANETQKATIQQSKSMNKSFCLPE